MNTLTETLPSTLELRKAGQSPWLDFISRQLFRSGKLKSFIQEFGLLGVTSNPSIFEKAISDPEGGYEKDIQKMIRQGCSTLAIYDTLTISDIQKACDLFLDVHKQSRGEHGFVSLEVLPNLAGQTSATVEEAERLYKLVNRPNVMIKVPATSAGIPAIRQLIGKGININVTLIFSEKHYQDVANAYVQGLADFKARGGNLNRVHSVASVFVSRYDTLLDKKLKTLASEEKDPEKRVLLEGLLGKAAIANSKMIYQGFKKIFGAEKFRALQTQGANIQKVLWGSTSTKNPQYSDLIYVDTLIGPETVNTMPLQTLEAFIDHGKVSGNTIESGVDQAKEVIRQLKTAGIDLGVVGENLQQDGVKAFCDSFDSLMKTIELIRFAQDEKVSPQTYAFEVDAKTAKNPEILVGIEKLKSTRFIERLFKKDPSVWKGEQDHQKVINNRLGWLSSGDWLLNRLYEIDQLCEQVKHEKVKSLVLLGMGGSSLAPEVMSFVFSKLKPKSPKFYVLDTTDPVSISNVEKSIDLSSTLFIVASKSGTTVETLSQYRYFYDKVSRCTKPKGNVEWTGNRFIAITDPGSWLEGEAAEKKFKRIFLNPPDIGGRYSALSYFGLVPAALMGIPVREILRGVRQFFALSEREQKVDKNSSVYLGLILGCLARSGKDKVTFVLSQTLASFGTWLEQLIAESTGKEGQGIIPIEGEELADVQDYGEDRVFVFIRLKGDPSSHLLTAARNLKKAGFPVLELEWRTEFSIGAEFLKWEIATAVMSAVLQINPFDEPNVKESKDCTGQILDGLKKSGKLPEPKNLLKVQSPLLLESFFNKLPKSGYLAILAYVEREPAVSKVLNRIRKKLTKSLNVPVLVGFGPRYLHSIGQLYKGGPKKGIFLELFSDEKKVLKVPQTHYTFGQLKKAQALGDLQAISSKGIEVLCVDLGKNTLAGLGLFEKKITAECSQKKP